MKLTKREVNTMKAKCRQMIQNPTCKLQEVLAKYWLERLECKGRYALRESASPSPYLNKGGYRW